MVKNNIVNTITAIIITGICLFSVFTSKVFARENWDVDNVHVHHGAWSQELSRWNTIASAWYEKVKSNQYMPQDSYTKPEDGCSENNCWENNPTGSKYCIGDKCWESDPTMFKIIDFDGNTVEIWKNRCSMTSEWFVFGDSKWSCKNSNQKNEFIGQAKEKWESDNFGQKLIYVNRNGDKWKSDNFGQGIMFEGVNGEKWDSNNFGQGLEHVDKSGEKWQGSKYDTKEHF